MAKKSPFSKFIDNLRINLSGEQQAPAAETSRPKTAELRLLFFIVDWNHANIVSDIFVEEHVRFHFISKGAGTYKSELLDLLGIGAGDKAVVLCLEQAILTQILLKEVRKKLGSINANQGIGFSIPLSAINDPVLLVFKQSIIKNQKITSEMIPKPESGVRSKNKGVNMANDFSHDLIVSVVNQGYSDDFMITAREAGASGGTVITARGQAHEGAVKFFGVSVQEEKELILILASRENKVNIMRAVSEAHGLNSKAHGIIFSLPVDNVMGINFD